MGGATERLDSSSNLRSFAPTVRLSESRLNGKLFLANSQAAPTHKAIADAMASEVGDHAQALDEAAVRK